MEIDHGIVYVYHSNVDLYPNLIKHVSFFKTFSKDEIVIVSDASLDDNIIDSINQFFRLNNLTEPTKFISKNLDVYGALSYTGSLTYIDSSIYDFYGFFDLSSEYNEYDGMVEKIYNLRGDEILISSPNEYPLMGFDMLKYNPNMFFAAKFKSNFDIMSQLRHVLPKYEEYLTNHPVDKIKEIERSIFLYLWCYRTGLKSISYWRSE